VADFMMKDNQFPSGVIVANEVDPKRCDRLATNITK
jgi:16S rRNA C967 or C1407 C5-methylase (RsmB/RsmF family)